MHLDYFETAPPERDTEGRHNDPPKRRLCVGHSEYRQRDQNAIMVIAEMGGRKQVTPGGGGGIQPTYFSFLI